MAAAKTAAKAETKKVYIVEVESNPNFCGVDVSNVQFAYGKAKVTDPWIAEWYKTHDGYKVTEVEEKPAEVDETAK